MSWLSEGGSGADDFERVFALRPELFEAWRAFRDLFWTRRLVDPVLLELCRLRIAGMLGARASLAARRPEARDAGLDESRIALLDSWWTSDRFHDAERACLRFAEQFALDPKQISDADAAAVVALLGDAGMVAFVEALAIFDGFARFERFLEAAPS
jgi:alkylhydroperoxidase family enzyme